MIEWDGRHGELDADTPDDVTAEDYSIYLTDLYSGPIGVLQDDTVIDSDGWGCQPKCLYRYNEPHPLLPCNPYPNYPA